jgi:RNA recognition motif-containing protein
MIIQVANLADVVDDHELARLFAPYGVVSSARVAMHSDTGKSTGVGFVEMNAEVEGKSAIAALNGRLHSGRVLVVCRSKTSPKRGPARRQMFGPMNMTDDIVPLPKPERRGLP